MKFLYMYPSSISRALCSDGMRCIKPLAPSRNETNSSRVNGGADRAILGICADGGHDQAFPRRPIAAGGSRCRIPIFSTTRVKSAIVFFSTGSALSAVWFLAGFGRGGRGRRGGGGG